MSTQLRTKSCRAMKRGGFFDLPVQITPSPFRRQRGEATAETWARRRIVCGMERIARGNRALEALSAAVAFPVSTAPVKVQISLRRRRWYGLRTPDASIHNKINERWASVDSMHISMRKRIRFREGQLVGRSKPCLPARLKYIVHCLSADRKWSPRHCVVSPG